MDWTDDAIVLTARRHGETSAVVTLMTPEHGRHAGLVRGGATPRARGALATGNRVRARWRGRLAEHLGVMVCEPMAAVSSRLLADGDRLAALVAACAIVEAALPERQPQQAVFDALSGLLDALPLTDAWPDAYVRWEVAMLSELGFGLELGQCAATGRNDQLAYVSPKTGRAVSLSAGTPYRDRLLPLPAFLLDAGAAATPAEVAEGLRLTGWFLARHAFPQPAAPPAARQRFVDVINRRAGLRTPA